MDEEKIHSKILIEMFHHTANLCFEAYTAKLCLEAYLYLQPENPKKEIETGYPFSFWDFIVYH